MVTLINEDGEEDLVPESPKDSKSEIDLWGMFGMEERMNLYFQYAPRLVSFNLSPLSYKHENGYLLDKPGITLNNYKYKCNDTIFKCSLPFFTDLENKLPRPYSYVVAKESENENIESSAKKDLSLMRKPWMIFYIGISSLINFLNMCGQEKKDYVKTKLNLFSGSIFYFVSIFFHFVTKPLKVLPNRVFDKIENDIEQNRLWDAYIKMHDLNYIYRMLLDPMIPGNEDIRLRYFLLFGKANQMVGDTTGAAKKYEKALSLSKSPEQKFFLLKQIINLYGRSENYKDYSQLFISKMPLASEQYMESYNMLHADLNLCLERLKNKKYAEAREGFVTIDFGSFHEFFYPGLTILYYQLKVAIVLCGDGEIYNISRNKEFDLDPEGRPLVALQQLERIKELIDKGYPEMSTLHKEYQDAFLDFVIYLPRKHKTNAEYMITSPLANCVFVEKRELSAEEQDLRDREKSWIPIPSVEERAKVFYDHIKMLRNLYIHKDLRGYALHETCDLLAKETEGFSEVDICNTVSSTIRNLRCKQIEDTIKIPLTRQQIFMGLRAQKKSILSGYNYDRRPKPPKLKIEW